VTRLRCLVLAFIAATLFAGCGGGDSGKDGKQKPADQTPKKNADDKPKAAHEPG